MTPTKDPLTELAARLAALVVIAVRKDFWDRRHHHLAGAVTKL